MVKNIKISEFPRGYDADELLAHAVVAHFMVNELTVAPRMEMRAHIYRKGAQSSKTRFGDEHVALVEQAVHLDYDNPFELLDDALKDNRRTLWFHYLLAFELAQLKGFNASEFEKVCRVVHKRLTELANSRLPVLALLHYDCALPSNMRFSGGRPEAMTAALFALLNELSNYSEGVWMPVEKLGIPHGQDVVLTVSDAYGTTNIVVEVNGIPMLYVDLNKDYILWSKDAGWNLMEIIQMEGGATMEKEGRLHVN